MKKFIVRLVFLVLDGLLSLTIIYHTTDMYSKGIAIFYFILVFFLILFVTDEAFLDEEI